MCASVFVFMSVIKGRMCSRPPLETHTSVDPASLPVVIMSRRVWSAVLLTGDTCRCKHACAHSRSLLLESCVVRVCARPEKREVCLCASLFYPARDVHSLDFSREKERNEKRLKTDQLPTHRIPCTTHLKQHRFGKFVGRQNVFCLFKLTYTY